MTSYALCDGNIEDEERRGWMLTCPRCSAKVRYTVLNLSPGRDIFLYCDKSSDFVLRDEDFAAAQRIDKTDERQALSRLREIYEDLEQCLPKCPSGGRFKIWSNVKCPHCLYEFPYNDNVRNEAVRFMESKLIWVEGAVAYRGGDRPSNRLAKVKVVSE